MKLLAVVAALAIAPAYGQFEPVNHAEGVRDWYVSRGGVNNSKCSESMPCNDIAGAIKQMAGGDHLYIKRGEVWREANISGAPSGTIERPTVISSWGAGARPVIETTGKPINWVKAPFKEHIRIAGLEFKAYKLDPAHPEFTGQADTTPQIALLGGHKNIYLEDNKFSHIEMVIQAYAGGSPNAITLRRNIFTGAYYQASSFNRDRRPSNLFTNDVQGLTILENVFDQGGWHPTVKGAGANMYNHNLYLQTGNHGNSLVVRGNIITRGSSHGIHGRPGGLYDNNFIARNAIGLQMGYDGAPLAAGTIGTAKNNVVSEGTHMVKGQSACSGKSLCTPAVWGIHLAEKGAGRFVLEGNIASMTYLPPQSQFPQLKRSSIATGLADVNKDNKSYRFASDQEGVTERFADPGRTLATYAASIGLEPSFEAFMDKVLNRAPGSWPAELSAYAINDYIRAGFAQVSTAPVPVKFQFVKPAGDIDAGQDLIVEVAPVTGETTDVADVDLYVNGVLLRREADPPYLWGALELDAQSVLKAPPAAIYELLALVIHPDGQEQKITKRVVVRGKPDAPAAPSTQLLLEVRADGQCTCAQTK